MAHVLPPTFLLVCYSLLAAAAIAVTAHDRTLTVAGTVAVVTVASVVVAAVVSMTGKLGLELNARRERPHCTSPLQDRVSAGDVLVAGTLVKVLEVTSAGKLKLRAHACSHLAKPVPQYLQSLCIDI